MNGDSIKFIMNSYISEAQQAAYFKKLLARPDNNICADCNVKGTSWVSLNFGVFVCINCSGVHRSFGMHITRVRSTKLDKWTKKDVKLMDLIGNKIGNLYWEYKIINKTTAGYDRSDRKGFLTQKYIKREFAKENVDDPERIVIDSKFKIKSSELASFYLPKKQSMFGKKTKKTDNKKSFDMKTETKVKKPNLNEEFDLLDLGTDNNIMKNEPKVVVQKNNNFDLFDMVLFDGGNAKQPPQAQKQIENTIKQDLHSIDLTGRLGTALDSNNNNRVQFHSHNVFNIQNVNIYNTPNTTQGNNQERTKSDKYSVFDVYKTFNTPHYRY